MDQKQVTELAASIMLAQRASRKAKHAKIYEPRSTTASSLGYQCDRRLVYARTKPELAAAIGEELASIFEEGNMHEVDVKKELLELGIDVMDGQKILRDEGLEIGARLDCKIPVDGEHRSERIALEIKSCTGKPPLTAEALKNHSGHLGRYYAQMQVYLFLTSSPIGMFLFKDKITGLWFVVVVPLDYEYAEGLLKKAERVRDHIKAGTLPDRLADRSECEACPFNVSVCLPADADVDPLLLANDKTLLKQLEIHETAKPHAKAFEKLDTLIKERFKMTKGERFVVGDENGFMIRKKKHGKGIRVNIERL